MTGARSLSLRSRRVSLSRVALGVFAGAIVFYANVEPAHAQNGASSLGAPAPRTQVPAAPVVPAPPASNNEEEASPQAPVTPAPSPSTSEQPTTPSAPVPAVPDVPVDALPSTVPPPPTGPPMQGGQGYGTSRYPQTGPRPYTPAVGFQLPSRLATRMRIISSDLQTLGMRSRNGSVDGILSMVSGGLSIGLGVWARRSSGERSLSSYLFLYGTANLARGVVSLALAPRPSSRSIRFTHMPMNSLEEAEARLRFGEETLEGLAKRAKLTRILQASINLAVGVAVIPIYLGPNDYRISSPIDVVVLIGSGISVVTGFIGLLNRSNYERRWNAYREMRDRLVSEESRVQLSLPSIAPLPGGAMVTSGGTF